MSNYDLTSLGSTELTYQTSTRLPVLYWEALADRLSPAQSSDLARGINLSYRRLLKTKSATPISQGLPPLQPRPASCWTRQGLLALDPASVPLDQASPQWLSGASCGPY